MLASTSQNISITKRLYGSKVSETTYKRDKLLELAKKDTNFRGEGKFIVVAIAATAGGSAHFASAVAAQEATEERRFFVTRKKEYQVYSIDNEGIEATKGNSAALVELLKRQVGGAKRKFDEALARRTHSAGGGSVGRLALNTTLTGTTGILRTRTDIVGTWELNMLIDAAASDGTGTSPGSVLTGGPLKVTAIDRDDGTFTTNAALNTLSGITNNSYLFRYGDFANAMTGIQGWAPSSDPTGGDSFFGLDRTVEIARLSGVRVNGSGKPKEETLQDAGAEAQIYGIEPKHCFVNPLDFKELGKELGGQRIQEGGKGTTGFSSIVVYIATGQLEIYSSPYVKKGFFWMGDAANFTLGTAGECPMDLAGTNGGLLTLEGADARQGRLGCYGNFWVDNPGEWLIGQF